MTTSSNVSASHRSNSSAFRSVIGTSCGAERGEGVDEQAVLGCVHPAGERVERLAVEQRDLDPVDHRSVVDALVDDVVDHHPSVRADAVATLLIGAVDRLDAGELTGC